jgi:hypothetical protein
MYCEEEDAVLVARFDVKGVGGSLGKSSGEEGQGEGCGEEGNGEEGSGVESAVEWVLVGGPWTKREWAQEGRERKGREKEEKQPEKTQPEQEAVDYKLQLLSPLETEYVDEESRVASSEYVDQESLVASSLSVDQESLVPHVDPRTKPMIGGLWTIVLRPSKTVFTYTYTIKESTSNAGEYSISGYGKQGTEGGWRVALKGTCTAEIIAWEEYDLSMSNHLGKFRMRHDNAGRGTEGSGELSETGTFLVFEGSCKPMVGHVDGESMDGESPVPSSEDLVSMALTGDIPAVEAAAHYKVRQKALEQKALEVKALEVKALERRRLSASGSNLADPRVQQFMAFQETHLDAQQAAEAAEEAGCRRGSVALAIEKQVVQETADRAGNKAFKGLREADVREKERGEGREEERGEEEEEEASAQRRKQAALAPTTTEAAAVGAAVGAAPAPAPATAPIAVPPTSSTKQSSSSTNPKALSLSSSTNPKARRSMPRSSSGGSSGGGSSGSSSRRSMPRPSSARPSTRWEGGGTGRGSTGTGRGGSGSRLSEGDWIQAQWLARGLTPSFATTAGRTAISSNGSNAQVRRSSRPATATASGAATIDTATITTATTTTTTTTTATTTTAHPASWSTKFTSPIVDDSAGELARRLAAKTWQLDQRTKGARHMPGGQQGSALLA